MKQQARQSINSKAIAEPSAQEIEALIDLFRQGRFAETEVLAREMTKCFPQHGFGWKALGTALLQQGRATEALQPLQKMAELVPADAQLQNNLGNTYAQLGRLSEAEMSYRQAIRLDPGFVAAYFNLGNTLMRQGFFPEAEASYRRTVQLKPDLAEAHHNLGNTLKNLSRFTDAEASYRRALELKPNAAGVHNNLGVMLYEQGRHVEAEHCYRQALKFEPGNVDVHYNLGNTLKKQNRLEEAAASFRICLEIDPADRLGARLLLAALGAEPLPLRASQAHLEAFYVNKAAGWDRVIDNSQKYFGAKLVAQALKNYTATQGKLDILDAGCGTGQVGLLVHDSARRLDGVDMSSSMLEKAREKSVYDSLHLADLESYLTTHPSQYDAITCAATLIHFGDLSAVFNAAATCLRDGGLFVFTVFQNASENEDVMVAQLDGLAKSGCYAHSRGYIERLAKSSGLAVEMLSLEIHEYRLDVEQETPIMCYLVALRRCRS